MPRYPNQRLDLSAGAAAVFENQPPPILESAAADLKDQIDFALGVERGGVGVLEDIAVDRQRHALLDLADESAAAPRSAA